MSQPSLKRPLSAKAAAVATAPVVSPPTQLRRLQMRVFSLTWLSYASYYLTRKNFSVVKARLESELGISLGMLGWIDTVFQAAYAMGQFVNGSLGDQFGPRRLLGLGMLASAGCSVLFGFSSVSLFFLLAYGLNGIFQSTGWPNGVKAMAPWFGERERGKIMGLWCTNYQVGGLAATALATALLVHSGWRAAFWVPSIGVAVVGLLVLLFLVDKPEDRGLAPVLSEAVPQAKGSFGTLREMLKKPAVWVLGSSYFGMKLIRYSLLGWLPYYMSKELGYSEGMAGYTSVAFEAGGVVGAVATGWITDRYFAKQRARFAAPMLFLLAGVCFLYPVLAKQGIWPNAIALGLIGFLLFGPDTLVSGACAQDEGGAEASGAVAGIINGIGSLGAIAQGILVPQVKALFGWSALFYVFVLMALISGSLLLLQRSARATR